MNRGGRGGNQQQQQQKMQTDLRDANKATRVRLAVPADPVRERHEAQAKTLNALMLVVAFVAALLALVFDVALLVWFAAICTVAYYSGADHTDPNTNKKTITAASATVLALARVYVFN